MAFSYSLFFLLLFPTSTLVKQKSNNKLLLTVSTESAYICKVAQRKKTNNEGLLS